MFHFNLFESKLIIHQNNPCSLKLFTISDPPYYKMSDSNESYSSSQHSSDEELMEHVLKCWEPTDDKRIKILTVLRHFAARPHDA